MRSAPRNRRSVSGSVEHRASTSPLAEVRCSGRPMRWRGSVASIMKSAVASRSIAAMRRPPMVIRGTSAVAALPSRLMRRSSILSASLAGLGHRGEFVEHDADELALGAAERAQYLFQAVVDVEAGRQHRHQRVGIIEQLTAAGREWRRGAVEDHEVIAAGGARLLDGLADGVSGLGWVAFDGRQYRDAVECLDLACGLAADRKPSDLARLALAGTVDLVRERVRLMVGIDHQNPGAVARGREREIQRRHAAPGGLAGTDERDDRH